MRRFFQKKREIKVKKFKATDLNRASGAVLEEAMIAPISVSRNGRSRFVIVPSELYKSLTKDMPDIEKLD